MIKLKSLIKEITAEQKATSWLEPSGKFHYINYNHGSTASEITGTNNDPMMILWKKGWQRVSYYSHDVLFTNNDVIPPNDLQKRLLINLAKELGFNMLKYDGEKGTHTLWSDSDVLENNLRKQG